MLNGWIPFGGNEHAFPAKMGTTVVVDACESCAFHRYTTFFPTASSNARLTATFANCTL